MTKLISGAGAPKRNLLRDLNFFATDDATETRGTEMRVHGHKFRKKREKIKI